MVFGFLRFFKKNSPTSGTSPASCEQKPDPRCIAIEDLPEFIRHSPHLPPHILRKMVLNGLVRLEKEGISPFSDQKTKR